MSFIKRLLVSILLFISLLGGFGQLASASPVGGVVAAVSPVAGAIDTFMKTPAFAKFAQEHPTIKLSTKNLNRSLGQYLRHHPTLKGILSHKRAASWLADGMQVASAVDSVFDAYDDRGEGEGGWGGVIAESVYQAVRFAGQKWFSAVGAKVVGSVFAGAGSAVGPVGTISGGFVGGFLGGMAGNTAAGLAVDYAFLDKLSIGLDWFGANVEGFGLRRRLAVFINDLDDDPSSEVVDYSSEVLVHNQELLNELHQRFTNRGFLNTGSSGLIGVGGLGLIRGQLVWYNNSDLDIHLILPSGAGHVYYGNSSITFNDGNATAALDHDNLGGVIDAGANQRIENITVTGIDVPAGNYQFYVHNFSAHGNANTSWNLTLTGDAAQSTQPYSGTFTSTGETSATYNVNSPGGSF